MNQFVYKTGVTEVTEIFGITYERAVELAELIKSVLYVAEINNHDVGETFQKFENEAKTEGELRFICFTLGALLND